MMAKTRAALAPACFGVSLLISVLAHANGAAKVPGSLHPPSDNAGAAAAEPAIVSRLDAAGWQLPAALTVLPPVEFEHRESLEFQDFRQLVFDDGALRLCLERDPAGDDVFALLADTSRPAYRNFATLESTPRHTVYRRGPYALVIPIRSVGQEAVQALAAASWSADALQNQLGPPSYRWHVHGVGNWGLTYVPHGLSFMETRGGQEPSGPYRLQVEGAGSGRDGTPAVTPVQLDASRLENQVRAAFADGFLGQRLQIDKALAEGIRSPDGRFVAGPVNLGGLANTEEIVIKEHDRPERRYHAPHYTIQKNYRWLNSRTLLFFVYVADQDFYTLDVLTGSLTEVASVPYDPPHSGNPKTVIDFDVSGARQFWYRTLDGITHRVQVPSGD